LTGEGKKIIFSTKTEELDEERRDIWPLLRSLKPCSIQS